MPRVGYALPMQGFRPRTNPSGALGRYGLRGLGDSNTFSGCVSAVDGQGNPVSCGDPSAAVWFDANMNAAQPGTAASVPAGAQIAAGVPTGSFLKYQGSWTTTQSQSAADILQAVSSALASDGLPVVQASDDAGAKAFVLGAFGVAFNVTLVLQVTGPGFAQASDAGSIVNHEVYKFTKLMPTSSSVSVSSTGPGGSGSGTPSGSAPGATDWSQWLQDNALWVGIAVLAVAVGPTLIKKVL
jgi:hypothetical protein